MAFNFLGTIESLSDFEEFQEFVETEAINIDNKIDHLVAEVQRYQELLDKFLVADLTLRNSYNKSDLPDKNWLSSPRQNPKIKITVPDALNGMDVDSLKKMFLDNIKSKREKNEFKIKKVRDLIEQINNEITFLTDQKDLYNETLSRISSRFEMDGFKEIEKYASEDNENIKNIKGDFGKATINGVEKYMITAINVVDNSITFERSAPPVKKGDTIIVSNGKNDGVKTVVGHKSYKTVIVSEPLVQESPSQSLAVINK